MSKKLGEKTNLHDLPKGYVPVFKCNEQMIHPHECNLYIKEIYYQEKNNTATFIMGVDVDWYD